MPFLAGRREVVGERVGGEAAGHHERQRDEPRRPDLPHRLDHANSGSTVVWRRLPSNHAIGRATSTVAPIASAPTPSVSSASPPASASVAPEQRRQQVVRAEQLPALGRRRPVGELGRGRDEREVPAQAEPEEEHGDAQDGLDPEQADARQAHHRQPADERRAAPDPVDQRADEEHERVHAEARARRRSGRRRSGSGGGGRRPCSRSGSSPRPSR